MQTDSLTRTQILSTRTRHFALAIIRLCREELGPALDHRIIESQLLRSATGLAANYRAAIRASSRREFVARIRACVEEADEAALWLDMLAETELVRPDAIAAHRDEARQLTAIMTASHKTARKRLTSNHAPPLQPGGPG